MSTEVLQDEPVAAKPRSTRSSRAKPSPAPTQAPVVELAQPGDDAPTAVAAEVVDVAEIRDGQAIIKLSYSEQLVATLTAEAQAIDPALITTDADVEKAARQFRMRVSASVTDLKERGLAMRRPAADFSALVLKAERAVEVQLRAIHKTFDEVLSKLDADRAAERERKAAEAAAAAQKVTDAVNAIAGRPAAMVGKTAEQIAEAIKVLEAIEIDPELYGDQAGKAVKARMDSIATLQNMHAATVAQEAQQAAMAAQQAELAAQQQALERSRAAQAAIDAISARVVAVIGRPSADVLAAIQHVENIDHMDDVFAGRDVEAMAAQNATLATLRQLLTVVQASEKLAADQAAQQAQLDAQRRQQEERQADLDRAEQASREEAARVAREAQERREAITARITRMVELPESLEAQEAGSVVISAALRTLNDTVLTVADFGDRLAEADSLKVRVLDELRNLHTAAVAEEAEQDAQREAEEQERQRVAAETAAREAAEAAARARVEAAREVAPQLLAVLIKWRDADAAGDEVALAHTRADRDRVLSTFNA